MTGANRSVLRFSATERSVHWAFSGLFLLLAATGSALFFPVLSLRVGNRALIRQIHIVSGLALLPVPAALAVLGDRRGTSRTFGEILRFDGDDAAFLRRRPSRPGRFNGGQKLNTWWTVASAGLFLFTGVISWRWTAFSPGVRAGSSRLHLLLALSALVVLAGHLHLSLVHRSTRPSLRGVLTGHVDEAWARRHHPRWIPTTDDGGARNETPAGRSDSDTPLTGRRTMLGILAAGVGAVASGGRYLPELDRLFGSDGWRIYNVAGSVPRPETFRLLVDGLVDHPIGLDRQALEDLVDHAQVTDFECVTGWKVEGVRWRGVRLATLLDLAKPSRGASHITFHSRDGVYTDSLSLDEALAGDTLIATSMDGRALPLRHGGPARLVVGQMYGYKSVKWIGRLEVSDAARLGYWEQRGYAVDARIDPSAAPASFVGQSAPVPGLPYRITVPTEWDIQPLPAGGAIFLSPRDGAVQASILMLTMSEQADRATTRDLLAGLERAGLRATARGAITADSFSGDTLVGDDGTGQRFLFAFFPTERGVLQFQAQAPADEWATWDPRFRQMAASITRS